MSAFLTGFQDYLKNQKCVSSNTLQSYVRDIEQYMEYEEPMKAWRDPERPSAGVLVQAVPSGDENQLELQFIASLDD